MLELRDGHACPSRFEAGLPNRFDVPRIVTTNGCDSQAGNDCLEQRHFMFRIVLSAATCSSNAVRPFAVAETNVRGFRATKVFSIFT